MLYADEVEMFEIYILLRSRIYESDRPIDTQSIIAILETYGYEGSDMLSAFRILSRLDNMYIDRVRQTQDRERKKMERKVKR